MFGYIRPEKKSLMVCELFRFRSIYCGLCKQIKREYGNIPRLSLTYDLTFLATLLVALSDDPGDERKENCILNPIRRKTILVRHHALERCAGIGLLLFAAKLEDNIQDQKNVVGKASRKGIAFPILSKLQKLKKGIPLEAAILKEGLTALSDLEKTEICDEKTCQTSSEIFAMILKQFFGLCASEYFENEPRKEMLREGFSVMGFYIGKWIYLMDAIHDYPSDTRHHRFNPFSSMDHESAKSKAEDLLIMCEERIDAVAALLPYKRDSGIIRNIIQRGMPETRKAVLCGKKLEKI